MLKPGARSQSRAAIAAVVLFLVFDFTALALNFWLSWKIEKQAIAINLAGRQRMLSQRLTKVLLQLERTPTAEEEATLHDELRLTYTLFDDTLQGFALGHSTLGGSNATIYLEPLHDPKAQPLIAETFRIWQDYRKHVQALLNAESSTKTTLLQRATEYAIAQNLTLLDLMNRLTSALEAETQREAAKIRLFQGLAFLLALCNAAGALLIYAYRFRQANRQQNLLDEIINQISASVVVLDRDAATIVRANKTAEDLFGYRKGELSGKQISGLLHRQDGNIIGLRKDATQFPAQADRNEVQLDGQRLFIETISDLTEQRMTEEHLSGLAYHDVLTKLPNRLLFDDRLRMEIAQAQLRGCKLGVLFIDLDNFKGVNDKHGHEIGDKLLQDAAVRLKRCLRESDTISRRGGDEFTAIIGNIAVLEDCVHVAQVIVAQLEKTFHIDGQDLRIGASVGISIYPDHGDNPQQLLGHADEAMYRAKQNGRGMYCCYQS